MSDTDVRITPSWVTDPVKEFAEPRILRDVCTEPDNPVGTYLYWTKSSNSLELAWARSDVTNWCNHPFSRGSVVVWTRKCIAEARDGAEILQMTRADVRTSWFKLLRQNADAVCFIARGVGFLEPLPEGGYKQLPGDTVGHAIWYYGQRRARFERIFSRLGWVVHLPGPCELAAE